MATNGSQNIQTSASGKVLQGAGVGTAPVFSTATYPATATGTGTILRADGTNFVATTAAYPDLAGTSGNVLMSDGTSWVSSALTSSNFTQFISTADGVSPADSTTYYFVNNISLTAGTTPFSPSVKYLCPITCTITRVYGVFTVSSGTPSLENCTLFLRKNDTTNTTVSSTIQLLPGNTTVSNTGLSISLVPGDILVWGFTTPAWATNPVDVWFTGAFST
jgi:hypothetical protein